MFQNIALNPVVLMEELAKPNRYISEAILRISEKSIHEIKEPP